MTTYSRSEECHLQFNVQPHFVIKHNHNKLCFCYVRGGGISLCSFNYAETVFPGFN